MTDPLGFISNALPISREIPGIGAGLGSGSRVEKGAGDFKKMLEQQIAQVNHLQKDATAAIEDLAAGRRSDVESVMIATQKADTAFKLLLQVRNKVMEAYDEVKQLRV